MNALAVTSTEETSVSSTQSRVTKSTARTSNKIKPVEREHRVTNQPAFVLHSYPYKETSLIIEVFARDFGSFLFPDSPSCLLLPCLDKKV